MTKEFSRSVVAQAAAAAMIVAARKSECPKGAMVASPVLAEAEKELFLLMLARFADRRKAGTEGLSTDEISSLFTFVCAKAAEAVTNWCNSKKCEFNLSGMLDGKIPIYAEERLTGHFKKLTLPSDCAQAYLDWHAANAADPALQACDPILPLFEALKWCFRLSCTAAVEKLEEDGGRVPGV